MTCSDRWAAVPTAFRAALVFRAVKRFPRSGEKGFIHLSTQHPRRLFFFLLIYLATPGLSCGTQGLLVGSMWDLVP